MDEADGIKPLVEKALSKSEFAQMNKPGSSAMYVKSDVWGKGQEVIIITGAGDKGVETARKGNRRNGWISSSVGLELRTRRRAKAGHLPTEKQQGSR